MLAKLEARVEVDTPEEAENCHAMTVQLLGRANIQAQKDSVSITQRFNPPTLGPDLDSTILGEVVRLSFFSRSTREGKFRVRLSDQDDNRIFDLACEVTQSKEWIKHSVEISVKATKAIIDSENILIIEFFACQGPGPSKKKQAKDSVGLNDFLVEIGDYFSIANPSLELHTELKSYKKRNLLEDWTYMLTNMSVLNNSTQTSREITPLNDDAINAHIHEFYTKFQKVKGLPDITREEILSRIDYWKADYMLTVGCGNLWYELAKYYWVMDLHAHAATYAIRFMRALGHDFSNILDKTCESLRQIEMDWLEEPLRLMYDQSVADPAKLLSYLNNRFEINKVNDQSPLASLEINSSKKSKVSIIVSLYNAEAKLKKFLELIMHQTMIKQGLVEFVFVDSNSPSNEKTIINRFFAGYKCDYVYARSYERETIQAAWNRGIGLASSPYLVFLGVDESLYPTALEKLAKVLDEKSEIDWVMSNSLVTDVDENGDHSSDVMLYDRSGYTQDDLIFDTCAISWVGGMYRANIHERFGYYDPRFTGAGDTEFKQRVMKYLKVEFLPETLGLFLNYPDERVTASPIVELEDTLAWYAFRTEGGLAYCFDGVSLDRKLNLLLKSMSYRKTFCKHVSSDINIAEAMAGLIFREFEDVEKSDNAQVFIDGLHQDLIAMKLHMEKICFIKKPSAHNQNFPGLEIDLTNSRRYSVEEYHRLQKQIIEIFEKIQRLQTFNSFAEIEKIANSQSFFQFTRHPSYDLSKDNRFEQHMVIW